MNKLSQIYPIMAACTRLSLQLYGLNGYALQLETAVAEARQSRQQQVEKQTALIAPAQAIQTVYHNGHTRPPADGITSLNFEQLFRASAKQSTAEVTSR